MRGLVVAFLLGLITLVASQADWATHRVGQFTQAEWLTLITLLAWSPVVVFVIRKILRIGFRLRKKYVELPVTDESARSARRAISLLGASFIWTEFVPVETLPYPQVIFNSLHFILVASGVWLVVSVWEGFCDSLIFDSKALDRRAENLLVPVTRKMVRAVILVGGFLVLLGTYSVDWKGIVAGLGIGGLVVALAAKDSVENLFGSLTILFDMPFALGDWVKVGAVDGVVEEINLRSTRIRTFEDSIITLPNSNLIKASVENMGARRVRRQKFFVRFSYETKIAAVDQVKSDLKQYLGSLPEIEKGRTLVELNDFSEASFGLLVQCHLQAQDFADEIRQRGNIMRQILILAETHGAEFFNGQSRLDQPPVK